MDGDKPDKSRRGLIWAGVGTVVGIAASQLYEIAASLDERLPSVIREQYRADILPYLDQIKACENRITEIQSELSNIGLLETEYDTELQKAYENLDAAIAGAESVVNKYKPILGSDALLVEYTMLDFLKKHRIERSQHQEQISQLNSQITTMKDRIEGIEGELETSKSYFQNDFVTISGTEFVLKGTPYIPCGFNYNPRDHPWKMFEEWDPEEIRYELELGKSLNANAIRIFDIRLTAYPIDELIKKTEAFLSIADILGYKTIFTLFDFPSDDLYNINLAREYLEYIIPKFSQDPRILAWDLKNEPYWDFEWAGRKNVVNFLSNVSEIVRSLDGNHMITVGGFCPIDMSELEEGWEVHSNVWKDQYIPELKGKLDFICVHHYDGPEYLVSAITKLKNETGKPVVLEEFGLHSWPEDP